jgi:signal transduction histidine kinase
MTNQTESRWGVRQYCILMLLIGASLLGNLLAPKLFTGFNYLFGSVGVILVLRLFGVGWSVVAALLAAAWCKQLFGHYYAMVWLGLEPLFVWFWLKRRPADSLILADSIYWIVVGGPLLIFIFLVVLKVPLLGTSAAVLMYLAIGVTNSLFATLIMSQSSLGRLVWPDHRFQRVTIAQFIFQVLMLAIVLPALLVLVLSGQHREYDVKLKLFDTLEIKARQVGYEVRQKIYGGSYPKVFGAKQRAELDLAAVTKLLQGIQTGSAISLHLMANKGEVIASTNPDLSAGGLYDPLQLGNVTHVERDQMFLRMPANHPPVPLWQRAGKSSYIRMYPIPGSTMYVVAETLFEPYQARILRGHRDSLAALLVYLVSGAVLASLLARHIATPLVQLSSTTTDLPGRLLSEDIIWPESGIVEVHQLIENSQKMSHTLSGQFREIAQINADLEDRVAERTRELSETNLSLRQEIDERIKAERERDRLMRELETKNKELESIIYVSSHDLRSPLVNIQGFSRKLAKNCISLQTGLAELELPSDRQQELVKLLTESMPRSLDFITGSVEKMDSLLSGLLRLSRLGRAAIVMENLDMNLVMSKIINSLAYQIESAGARIVVDTLLPCQGDAIHISQVFTNLLDNAIKYRSADRTLEVLISSRACTDGVRYCVADNGIGIRAEYQAQVWEIFQRINPRDIPGEGLGLTVCRRILDRLNGTIWLEAEEGTGSRFYVKLPAQRS